MGPCTANAEVLSCHCAVCDVTAVRFLCKQQGGTLQALT